MERAASWGLTKYFKNSEVCAQLAPTLHGWEWIGCTSPVQRQSCLNLSHQAPRHQEGDTPNAAAGGWSPAHSPELWLPGLPPPATFLLGTQGDRSALSLSRHRTLETGPLSMAEVSQYFGDQAGGCTDHLPQQKAHLTDR